MPDDILEKIQTVARDVFEDDALVLTRQTIADDVEGWDSLNHMQFILKVEKCFGIRLSLAKITALKNVGDLVDAVQASLT
jgi:acyl carrier protein